MSSCCIKSAMLHKTYYIVCVTLFTPQLSRNSHEIKVHLSYVQCFIRLPAAVKGNLKREHKATIQKPRSFTLYSRFEPSHNERLYLYGTC